MLRYRVLLIDTEAFQERPVQAFLNSITEIQNWAEIVLRKASKSASVVVYRIMETEVAIMRKNDKGTVQGLRPVEEEAGQQV